MTNLFQKLGLVETSEPTTQVPSPTPVVEKQPEFIAPSPSLIISSDTAIAPYELAFSKLNTPEFDLYEFYQAIQKMGDSNIRNIFDLGKTLNPNLTKDLLLKQCDEYLQTITGSSKQKIDEYKINLAQKQEQLKIITQEVSSLQSLLSERETGYNLFVGKINDLKNKISHL